MIDKRRTRDGEVRYEVRLRGTDGKERSRTFRTKKEAERYERTQQTAIEQGLWVDPRAGKVTLEYIDLYLIHWPAEGVRRESWRELTKVPVDSV